MVPPSVQGMPSRVDSRGYVSAACDKESKDTGARSSSHFSANSVRPQLLWLWLWYPCSQKGFLKVMEYVMLMMLRTTSSVAHTIQDLAYALQTIARATALCQYGAP